MRVASIERSPLALVSVAANCLELSTSRGHMLVPRLIPSHVSTCVIFTRNPSCHVTSHVTDFPFGNDLSPKSTFVISPEIPEPRDPQT